jgi:hypothetical protein
MKYLLISICLIGSIVVGCKGKQEMVVTSSPEEIPSTKMAVDLALIYHGGPQRLDWNTASIKHYVYREENKKVEWLYDGFLFLEFIANINGQQVDFEYDGLRGGRAATKADWSWLLDRTFANGKGPHAVESTLDSLARLKKYPPFRRRAVFALPTPIFDQKNWGAVDHKNLDFNKVEDRAKAVIWYIDQIIDMWKQSGYRHLDFGGFYWTHEAVLDKHQDRELIGLIKTYLDEIDQPLSWIPYYGAENSPFWKEIGFDTAFQQPNYFFEVETPMEILTGAIKFAQDNKLSLEMEYDERVSQPEFRKKFYEYINKFDEVHAWDQQSIAYYDGDGAWYHLSISVDREMQQMKKRLGDLIVNRQLNYKNIEDKR